MRTTIREKAILWLIGLPVALLLAAVWNTTAVGGAFSNVLIAIALIAVIGGVTGAIMRTRNPNHMAH